MRIDIDSCEEILITITRNKTRSLLTAFGVFWGIFMLVALIGGGRGDAAGYEFPVRGLCHEFCFSGFAEDGGSV